MKYPLSDDVLSIGDVSIIGMKDSGKTYTAKTAAERQIALGRRVIALDPLGSWWGLRHGSDGSASALPIFVLGGDHANIPITSDMGEVVARILSQTQCSIVLDMWQMKRGESQFFASWFLNEFYERHRRTRSPLWMVIDEADRFAPQTPRTVWEKASLSIVDEIARRSRTSGIRLYTLTQRPARINKDVVSEASTVIVLRLVLQHDRRFIREWVQGSRNKTAEMERSLPGMRQGEAWIYTRGIDLYRARFPKLSTLDSSVTPEAPPLPCVPLAVEGELARLKQFFEAEADEIGVLDSVQRAGRCVVSAALMKLRAMLGDSQEEFARKLGMHQSNYSRIESGANLPNVATLVEIAEATGSDLRIDFRPQRRELSGAVVPFPRLVDKTGAKDDPEQG